MIQEKLDPKERHSLRNYEELASVLGNEDNRCLLKTFTNEVQALYDRCGIMLDLEWDNVRFYLDEGAN